MRQESSYGMVAALAEVIGATRKFAGRVVAAVRAGTEAELYKRRRRKTAVTPEMVKEQEEFLALPTVSRSCPGETVSVAYGKRKPKHRMSCSKEAALLEFQATQSSQFSVTTLLQYWPKQFVIPSSNDRRRNVCPIHDNWPRLVQGMHSVGVGENLPSSCRAAATMAQCSSGQDASDPLSWSKHCALGSCSSCPVPPVEVRPGVDMGSSFTFQEWRKGLVARTNDKGEARQVFTLHNTITTINEGPSKGAQVPRLCRLQPVGV